MIPELLVWWKRFIGLGRSAYPAFLDTMASNFFCKTASTGEDDDGDDGGDDDGGDDDGGDDGGGDDGGDDPHSDY